jgi:hypothetical protein
MISSKTSHNRIGAKGEGMMFADTKEALRAYRVDAADLHAKVKIRISETIKDENGEEGTMMGSPLAGAKMLLVDIINARASS